MILWHCCFGVRLVLRHSVDNHDAVAQMDMVARHANESLDQVHVVAIFIGHRFVKDHNIAALGLTVVNERHPFGGWSEGDAIYQQMVAHQECLFH